MTDIIFEILEACITACVGTTAMSASDITISNDMAHLIDSVWGYFAIVGVGMTIIYFLMEVNRKLAFERNDFSMQSMFAPFLKLAAAIIVLANGGKLIGYIISAGNAAITAANGWDIAFAAGHGGESTTGAAELIEDMRTMTDGLGFFMAIAMLLPCFCMYIVSIVCSLVWKFKALTYKIEVLFRVGISPIALADIYSGQNAQAIRWCKAMLGVGLYGMSFILVIKLGHAIALQQIVDDVHSFIDTTSGATVWSLFSHLIMIVIVPIAELGVIGTVRSAIKEALA